MKTIKYVRYVFFDKKTVASFHKLARRYGIKENSYAGKVLYRIYHCYFGDATDMKKEYRKYYKKEFEDYDNYLECHLKIPENVRNHFVGHRVFYVNLDEKGDDLSLSFSDDDMLKNQFWNIIGGLEDESSSGIRYEQLFN